MKELYLLSGLGADKRVFDFIDLSDYKVYHIEWVAPLDGESMEDYAKRLLPQIKTPRPILVGVSFGGMMTVEIAKLIDVEKAIVISSAKTNSDIPFYYRVIGQLGLNKLIPTWILKSVNALTFWLFGTKTQKEKDMLRAIIKGTDDKFLKWAVDKIVNWKNTTRFTNLAHVHGTTDKILPLGTADYKIIDGGHLMIVNKGQELSGLIKRILE